jgi:hypothetical protein
MSDKLDEIRENTLAQIEKAERNYKLAFVGAAAVELAFLAAYLLLADFSNRLHVLLLLATIATYTVTAFGLITLGAHINRSTLRVLKAIGHSAADD